MPVNNIHVTTVEMLLSSITRKMGEDGAKHSFLFGKPNMPIQDRRMAAEIYYHPVETSLTALYVRSQGPKYLKSLPLQAIISKLQKFLSENFWGIARLVMGSNEDRPFNQWIPDSEKSVLAEAISKCSIFSPINELTFFPLIPINVQKTQITDSFFFVSASSDDIFQIIGDDRRDYIDPAFFPINSNFDGPRKTPQSWLGVPSPDYRAAMKIRSSILGAVALTQLPNYRHMFSGRDIFGGRCTLNSRTISYSFDTIHTPKCMNDIQIGEADEKWLTLLSSKIQSTEKATIRELKSLEYFYRAWPKDPVERFPILCMALDAIYGDANNATQAVIDGVRGTLGEQVSEPQLRSIQKLRASVIHGGAPDVYDSSKYAKHYRDFGSDPISDLELVVGACLRRKIFSDCLIEHVDPSAEVLAKLRAEGRIPPISPYSIINPKPQLL